VSVNDVAVMSVLLVLKVNFYRDTITITKCACKIWKQCFLICRCVSVILWIYSRIRWHRVLGNCGRFLCGCSDITNVLLGYFTLGHPVCLYTRNSAKLTVQRDSFAFSCSPFTKNHLLRTSNSDIEYTCSDATCTSNTDESLSVYNLNKQHCTGHATDWMCQQNRI